MMLSLGAHVSHGNSRALISVSALSLVCVRPMSSSTTCGRPENMGQVCKRPAPTISRAGLGSLRARCMILSRMGYAPFHMLRDVLALAWGRSCWNTGLRGQQRTGWYHFMVFVPRVGDQLWHVSVSFAMEEEYYQIRRSFILSNSCVLHRASLRKESRGIVEYIGPRCCFL